MWSCSGRSGAPCCSAAAWWLSTPEPSPRGRDLLEPPLRIHTLQHRPHVTGPQILQGGDDVHPSTERPQRTPCIGQTRDRARREPLGHELRARHQAVAERDRKSTRLNSSHVAISYAVFCLKKKRSHHSGAHRTSMTNDES